MSPQRLVAAIAAVAIGFGVTLVGVQLAEDDDTVATIDAVDQDPAPTEADPADDNEAQQDEAAAEPTPDAEVVADADAADDVGAGDDADDAAPVATAGGETPPREGADDGAPTEPGVAPGCERVLVVRTGSGELLVLSGELGEFTESGGSFFLPGSDESVGEQFRAQDLALISGVIDDRSGRRSVEDCETGEVVEATIRVSVDDGPPSAPVPGEGDDAATAEFDEFFPCSDAAFDALLDELDGLEATELIDDDDVFVRVVAKTLARLGGLSVAEWEADLEQVFSGFVAPEDCVDEVDAVFVRGGGTDFLCAAANVSADPGLFAYLDELVPDQMSRCTYVHGEGVN